MRVKVVSRPTHVIGESTDLDAFRVGNVYELPPRVALLMLAAHWVRREQRRAPRRSQLDRRSI